MPPSFAIRSAIVLAAALCALFEGSAQAQSATAACQPGPEVDTWLEVRVRGVRSEEGQVRVQVYSDDPAEFLRRGTKLVRVEVPSRPGDTHLCVPLPASGRYALVAMHDRNANGRADIYTEGFGFSNNPRLGISPPDHAETLFVAAAGATQIDVFLTYVLFGRFSPEDPRGPQKGTSVDEEPPGQNKES